MKITPGMYVTHLHRKEWGIGKVLEGRTGTALRLWFELGGEKKIGVDYHGMLMPADPPASFRVPSVTALPARKATADKFHREYFAGRWDLPFSRGERERFKSGHLVRQWGQQYPFLFDAEDVERALDPAGKGSGEFFDWAAAVRLHEMRGYCSLMKTGAPSSSGRKRDLVVELAGEDVAAYLLDGSGKKPSPDLLVHTPDRSEWFFCDVKGPGDAVRKSDDLMFPVLAQKTGKPIYLVTLFSQ